jgi:hypothetical protein
MAVANRCFRWGGIACAGLLVVEDFLTAWRRAPAGGDEPDLICLPGRGPLTTGELTWSAGPLGDEEATGITTARSSRTLATGSEGRY